MRNKQAWADLGGWIEVDVRNHGKELSYDAKPQPRRCPQPLGSTSSNDLLQPVNRKRPKSFRPPAAVTVAPKTRQIRQDRSPLAVPRPRLDCVSVVLHVLCFASKITCVTRWRNRRNRVLLHLYGDVLQNRLSKLVTADANVSWKCRATAAARYPRRSSILNNPLKAPKNDPSRLSRARDRQTQCQPRSSTEIDLIASKQSEHPELI